MRRAEIRAAVDTYLAGLGYAREHYAWPKAGRLYLVVKDAMRELRIPSGTPKYKFRDLMRDVPRHGPSRIHRRITAHSYGQPAFAFAG